MIFEMLIIAFLMVVAIVLILLEIFMLPVSYTHLTLPTKLEV